MGKTTSTKGSEVVEWIERNCTHVKGEWAGAKFKLEDWQGDIIRELFGTLNPDGTRRYRTGLIGIPRKNGKSTLGAAIALRLLFKDSEPGAEVYCLDSAMRVLCSDLLWRPLSELAVGDEIVAYDEETPSPGTFRKLRTAYITSLDPVTQPSYRVELDDGREVVASATHRWYGMKYPSGQLKGWVETRNLQVGSRIRNLGKPWEQDTSWQAGYLAGVFDGEASFHDSPTRAGFRIAFGQLPGPVMDAVRSYLKEDDYNISPLRSHKSGVDSFEVRGLYDCLRFLGRTRPHRLLSKAKNWWEGKAPSRGGYAAVRSIEYLGEREVIAVGTTTKTLFVEGLFSHNSAAADREQAAIVFEIARGMVEANPAASKICKVYRRSIVVPRTGSVYKVLSADAYTKHGLSPHGVIFDELHAQPNRELWDVLTTGQGARRQPLTLAITTAGHDKESVCYELYEYGKRLQDKVIEDPTFFFRWWGIEEGEPWDDEATWEKAIPNLGVSVSRDFLRAEAKQAHNQPARENTYRRLYLNQWTQQHSRWVPLEAWDACHQIVDEAKLKGQKCYGGLDLASSVDIAALNWTFPAKGDHDYAGIWRFWVPSERLDYLNARTAGQASVWLREGHLRVTEGNVIDYKAILKQIDADARTFDVQELAYDRWGMTQLSQDLIDAGMTVVPFGQGYASMSAPTKEWERLVMEKRYRHGGNPVMRWMFDNIAVRQDPAGNVKIDKAKSSDKVDGAIAAVMGLDRAMRHEKPKSKALSFA